MAFSLGSAFKTDTLLSFIKDKYGPKYLKDLDYVVGKTPPINKNNTTFTLLLVRLRRWYLKLKNSEILLDFSKAAMPGWFQG